MQVDIRERALLVLHKMHEPWFCAQKGGMTEPHHVLPLLGTGIFKRSAEGPDTYVDQGVILYCFR